MAIPLYAAMANTGQIRQLDVRGTADDYDGTVPIAPSLVTNPIAPAGSGGYARLRRLVQSGVQGTSDEQLTCNIWRDGTVEPFAVTRDFPIGGALTIPLAGGATQLQAQITMVGTPGTELGSAELWTDPRRTLRSANGS